MSIIAVLVLFAVVIAVVIAVIVAAGAAALAHLGGAHPAVSIARGAVAFAATITLLTVVAGMIYSVLGN